MPGFRLTSTKFYRTIELKHLGGIFEKRCPEGMGELAIAEGTPLRRKAALVFLGESVGDDDAK